MITLYGGPTPNSRKIAIALLEMGLEWQVEPIDILAGDQLTPEFLALNPNNKTPVIVDDEGPHGPGFVLWETGAILQYLAEKTGSFLPPDPAARATCCLRRSTHGLCAGSSMRRWATSMCDMRRWTGTATPKCGRRR